MQRWPLSALRKATPSNSPLLPSMHCAGNFVPSINSPILTLTRACAGEHVVCSTGLSCLAAWVISFWNFLADDKFGGACMCHHENRRVYARKFQNEITLAMHAGQKRSVRRGHGLAASAVPVIPLLRGSKEIRPRLGSRKQ